MSYFHFCIPVTGIFVTFTVWRHGKNTVLNVYHIYIPWYLHGTPKYFEEYTASIIAHVPKIGNAMILFFWLMKGVSRFINLGEKILFYLQFSALM